LDSAIANVLFAIRFPLTRKQIDRAVINKIPNLIVRGSLDGQEKIFEVPAFDRSKNSFRRKGWALVGKFIS